jgi:hypothetical protein
MGAAPMTIFDDVGKTGYFQVVLLGRQATAMVRVPTVKFLSEIFCARHKEQETQQIFEMLTLVPAPLPAVHISWAAHLSKNN